ncbi:hypothetical protein Cflav_PD0813 [Pedosphaera parvula Ellin514]|uniref:Uncharacterized protein n=1 Tax=Pedosphaera parvula (strain Ellin514) TaxID=320771 RepID=B9XQP9_PEDPL|nr:hypothetical protein Cflav_PD0813 [Pedosphaera parvula Ellin514]
MGNGHEEAQKAQTEFNRGRTQMNADGEGNDQWPMLKASKE